MKVVMPGLLKKPFLRKRADVRGPSARRDANTQTALMFNIHAITKAGGRKVNEDAFDQAQVGKMTCWVLADGLGGHPGGEIASKLAVQEALRDFRNHPDITRENLLEHLKAAHDAILRRQIEDPDLAQMQSTLVMLVSDGSRAIWGHVGDSRLYHFRGGVIAFQTRDNSVSQSKADAGEIPVEKIRGDEDRNLLLQSAGKKERFRPTVLHSPVRLCRDDAFLLCVDGFWGKVMETEMEIDLAKSPDAKDWLGAMERRLRERLSQGADNYTAIAIRAINPQLPVPPKLPQRRMSWSGTSHAIRRLPTREFAWLGTAVCIAVGLIVGLRITRLPVTFPKARIAALSTPAQSHGPQGPPKTTSQNGFSKSASRSASQDAIPHAPSPPPTSKKTHPAAGQPGCIGTWPVVQVGSTPKACPGELQITKTSVTFSSATCPNVSRTWKYREIEQFSEDHPSRIRQVVILRLKTGGPYHYTLQPKHITNAQFACVGRQIYLHGSIPSSQLTPKGPR